MINATRPDNNSTVKNFFELLFSPGEATCFSPSPYGTSLHQTAAPGDIFFSINPMHTSRKDENVICFRNILLELDSVPLDEQIDLVLSRIGVSTIVYSGGKSYHFIISLDKPYLNRQEYDSAVKRLYKLFPEADKSCKNPSRFSRIPNAHRKDTKRFQDLIAVYGKVNRERFEALIGPEEMLTSPVTTPEDAAEYVNSQIRTSSAFPDDYIERMNCGRNAFFFWLGQRMDEAKLPNEKRKKWAEYAYKNLKNKKDFSLHEALKAARVIK